jgi:hypothetical protein
LFELKALQAYEWHANRQYFIWTRLEDSTKPFTQKGRFEPDPADNATTLLFAMRACGYDQSVLEERAPYLFGAFDPFDICFVGDNQDTPRVALLRNKVTPEFTISVGTYRNGNFDWLTYKSPRGSSNRPRRIVFRDFDNDGELEVDIVWYGKETKRDKAGMFISSKEVDIHTILKVSDEELVAVEE